MKYFLIAGEASGDLHAAHLMQALLQEDPDADFRFYGGDEMQRVGGKLLCHYKHLAYMGFIPVLLHLRTILRGIKLQTADCRMATRRGDSGGLSRIQPQDGPLRDARTHLPCLLLHLAQNLGLEGTPHQGHSPRCDAPLLYPAL